MSQDANAPLMQAILEDDPAAAATALEAAPALARATDANGIPLLLLALYHGRPAVAAAIRARRDSLDLFECAAMGETVSLREQLAGDETAIASRSRDGFTALHLAAFFARADAVAALIAAGADVDAEAANPSRVRPLHSATAGRDAGVLRELLAAGADPDARQAGGYTALHSAAKQGHLPMVETLLAHGADPSVTCDEGRTAVDFAREAGRDEVLARLGSES